MARSRGAKHRDGRQFRWFAKLRFMKSREGSVQLGYIEYVEVSLLRMIPNRQVGNGEVDAAEATSCQGRGVGNRVPLNVAGAENLQACQADPGLDCRTAAGTGSRKEGRGI